jgi:hypothetical protein
MSRHSKDDIREMYGRFIALYYVSQKIKDDDFWSKVSEADEDALSGICKVLARNIKSPDCRSLCVDGLRKILNKARVKDEMDFLFDEEDTPLPHDVVLACLSRIEDQDRLMWFDKWIAEHSAKHPEKALEALETLFKRLREVKNNHLWHADGLVAAAMRVLRYADMLDDVDLINRAVAVQDEIIRLNASKMEEALEDAARS